MAHHVYARVSGFGWSALPRAPFRLERVPHHPALLLAEHQSAGGPRRAKIDLARPEPVVELDDGTLDLAEVLELAAGPAPECWRIDTSVFSANWPEGFAVRSTSEPPGFDLVGPDGTLIFLQGPFEREQLPLPRQMAGDGQIVRRHGRDWVELDYRQEGAPWRQAHRLVAFGPYAIVVSSQAPAAWHPLVDAAAAALGASIAPAEPE